MKVSVASYSFHGLLREGKMDVFGYLESCKYRYHLQSADIWNGFLPSTEPEYLAKVREALDERELTLANLCVDGCHIWEDDPAKLEHNYQQALVWLKAAVILGAKTVRIDAGGAGDVFTEEQITHVVERYREYASFATQNGFRVGPENHWGPERIPANMARICREVGSSAFGVLLHFTNWGGENAERGDELIAREVMHTHVSWNVTEGDLTEKMELLRQAGYQGYWGIEHHTAKNEYTEVAVQLARVQDVLDRWRITQP